MSDIDEFSIKSNASNNLRTKFGRWPLDWGTIRPPTTQHMCLWIGLSCDWISF